MEEEHIACVARAMLKSKWCFVVMRKNETAHLQNFGPQQNSSNKEHHVSRVGTGLKEQA